MSLCDACRAPGRCCTGFYLQNGDFGRGRPALEVLVELATAWTGTAPMLGAVRVHPTFDLTAIEDIQVGMPFMPLMRRPADGAWRFWCPVLRADGRCGDYENRPALCRDYQAGSDKLCAEFDATTYERGCSKAES